uniref:Uncharacterized protein n=1 Tax=Arundo donax TaxID=35708 RepID=A0A0A9DL81_ARUDO
MNISLKRKLAQLQSTTVIIRVKQKIVFYSGTASPSTVSTKRSNYMCVDKFVFSHSEVDNAFYCIYQSSNKNHPKRRHFTQLKVCNYDMQTSIGWYP